MGRRIKAAICTDLPFRYKAVYAGSLRNKLELLTDLLPGVLTTERIRNSTGELNGVEVIFATWGITLFTEDDLDKLPDLKVVFYAAGSVKSFAQPLLKRGIRIASAWKVNAQPVSEFTLAHILLGCKGYLRNVESLRFPDPVLWRGDSPVGPGIYNQRIGVIGCGAIGGRVLELLKPFDLEPVAMDSFPVLIPT